MNKIASRRLVTLLTALLSGMAVVPAMAQRGPTGKVSDRDARLAERRDARTDQEAGELYRTAETTYLVGDLDRAAELFGRVLANTPTSAYRVRAHARLGDCAFQGLQFDRAAVEYRKAGEIADATTGPDELAAAVRSDFMVGQSNLAAKQYVQAFGNFRRFIDRHPGHALVNQAYQSIGDAHLALEQYQQALAAYRMVGTIFAQKIPAHRRITPGQRLYLRVTDADVNIGETLKTVTVVVRTTSGDEETLELQPLGLRNPVFIGSLPTVLGDCRHSGDMTRIFNDAQADQIRGQLAEAEKLLAQAQAKEREAHELEATAEGADPAGLEKQRSAAAAAAVAMTAQANKLESGACQAVDQAFTAVEQLLASWAPEQSLDNTRQRLAMTAAATRGSSTQPSAAPGPVAKELPTAKLDDAEGIVPSKGGGEADEELTGAGGPEIQGGMTQRQIDDLRIHVRDKPTALGNIDQRLTALGIWTKTLQHQFQRLELMGNDQITVEYYDEVGSNGPNDSAHAIKRDSVEVASDARLSVLTPDGREPLEQVVVGGDILLRVEDADRDITSGKDKISVVLAVIGGTDSRLAELRGEIAPATAPATQRSTPGEVVEPSTQPAASVPLVPPDAPNMAVTLTETANHSGIFELLVHLDNNGITGDGHSLPLTPGKALRVAYMDERCVRNPDNFVLVKAVECIGSHAGNIAAVRYGQTRLDMEAKLRRAVAAGELGKLYLDLGLTRRGKDYLNNAQHDCLEVAAVSGNTPMGEESLYRSWRIYFYAGLMDEAINAAATLTAKYPKSEYAPAAMLQIGQALLERGEKEAEEAKAAGEKPGENADLGRAIAELEKLLAQFPSASVSPEGLFLIGRAKIAAGQSGVDAFERLAKRYPDSGFAPRGLIRAANYYVTVGDFRRAEEYFSRILIDYPDSPQLGEVLLHRGVCQYKLGHGPEALKTLYQVMEDHAGTELAHTAQQYINFINQKRGE